VIDRSASKSSHAKRVLLESRTAEERYARTKKVSDLTEVIRSSAAAKTAVVESTPLRTGAPLGTGRDVVEQLDVDNHIFGTRPCMTCQAITRWLYKPFGCVRLQIAKAASNSREHL
jgi:hypothetical protein